jgi:protein-S-isoprenylcysteine O-methyltransferase Ste14
VAVTRQLVGVLLVGLQFGLLGALGAAAARPFMTGDAGAGAWFLLSSGLALGLWALACNRPGNFNIRPAPREGGQLVRSGPYRWIRHPMYSSVLLVGAACAWASAVWMAWLGLAALVAVLTVKAALEERWMLARHAGYADYRRRSRRFIPGLF